MENPENALHFITVIHLIDGSLAQSKFENFPIIGKDRDFDRYDVERYW